MNMSLQQLRRGGLIEFKGGRVRILNREAMQSLSGFDPTYLHLRVSDVEQIGNSQVDQTEQGSQRELNS